MSTIIVVGNIIACANYKLATREGRKNKYNFAGAEYSKRMKEVGLYTTNVNEVEIRILNNFQLFVSSFK